MDNVRSFLCVRRMCLCDVCLCCVCQALHGPSTEVYVHTQCQQGREEGFFIEKITEEDARPPNARVTLLHGVLHRIHKKKKQQNNHHSIRVAKIYTVPSVSFTQTRITR